jgi:hypothetical protein
MAPWRKQSRPPEPQPAGKFHITRLDPKPTPVPSAPISPEPLPANMFAARFTSPAAVLTFLVALTRASRRQHPPARRAPDGAIWALAQEQRPADIELAWALGGVVHLPDGQELVSPRGRRYRWADVQAWPGVSWVELAAGVAPGATGTQQQEILVVTTGSLARWIIERFQSADLDLRVTTATLRAIFRSEAEEWAAVLVRVTGRGRAVPAAFSHALSGLPHTVVCRLSGGRLLIDQRLDLPLPDEDLGRWVPGDQEWLLAGDLGVWQITERRAEYAPPLRADVTLDPPPVPAQGRLPPDLGVEVTLIRDEYPRTVDALLLSDEDLTPLRRFLTGHPAGERAFLILGPGWHLLAEPGRSVIDIPFGVPLHRIGPGALYQEAGYRLRPALPGPARARLFGLDATSLVVLRAGATHRLSVTNTVPAWSLWLGPTVSAETAAEPLSAAAVALLEQVDAADARLEQPGLTAGAPTDEQAKLHTEGFLLEQQGKLAEAAHKYWEAGKPALAARLYELAAEAES